MSFVPAVEIWNSRTSYEEEDDGEYELRTRFDVTSSAIFWALLLIPAAGSGLCLLLRTPRAILMLVCAGVLCSAAVAFGAAARVLSGGPIISPGEWFFLDALSAYHLAIMMIVFSLSSLYTLSYFRREAEAGAFTRRLARRFGALWFGALAAMTLVLISNNLGILWVGIEGHRRRARRTTALRSAAPAGASTRPPPFGGAMSSAC